MGKVGLDEAVRRLVVRAAELDALPAPRLQPVAAPRRSRIALYRALAHPSQGADRLDAILPVLVPSPGEAVPPGGDLAARAARLVQWAAVQGDAVVEQIWAVVAGPAAVQSWLEDQRVAFGGVPILGITGGLAHEALRLPLDRIYRPLRFQSQDRFLGLGRGPLGMAAGYRGVGVRLDPGPARAQAEDLLGWLFDSDRGGRLLAMAPSPLLLSVICMVLHHREERPREPPYATIRSWRVNADCGVSPVSPNLGPIDPQTAVCAAHRWPRRQIHGPTPVPATAVEEGADRISSLPSNEV